MSTAQTVEAIGIPPFPCLLHQIESAVEALLAKHLLAERKDTLPNEVRRENYENDYAAFLDWADAYDLPPTPHVAASYLLELDHAGVDPQTLRRIADAIFYVHNRDLHVPVRAALKFCERR
jgi:hypothetical protein